MEMGIGGAKPKIRSLFFSIEIGPNPETVESFVRKMFAGIGLTSPERIRAYNNYLKRNFNVADFYQDITRDVRNNSAVVEALKNSNRKKEVIKIHVFPVVVEHLRSFGINLTVNGQGGAKFTGYAQSFEPNVKKNLKTAADFAPAKETPIARWTTDDKLKEVIKRAAALLPAEVGKELLSLLDPLVLAAVVIVVVIWAGLHLVVAGEVLDVIVILLGLVALGPIAYDAAKKLIIFAAKTIGATTDTDLDEAAKNLSEAVAMIGIQVVLQLLLVKAPKVYRSFPKKSFIKPSQIPNVERTAGELFYKPKIYPVENFPNPRTLANTTVYGDIEYLSSLSGKLKNETILHEKVHSFLTPKLYLLRNFRISVMMNGYNKVALLQYLEEALAETVAQVGTYGVKKVLVGIRFPIDAGYVTLTQMATEAKGIFLGPINLSGMYFRVYFNRRKN